MANEWPINTIEEVRDTDPDEWLHFEPTGRYGPPMWLHDSGLILAVRGFGKRITLTPPYDDPRNVREIDGRYMETGAEEYVNRLINHDQ